jgi:hypothetical protein
MNNETPHFLMHVTNSLTQFFVCVFFPKHLEGYDSNSITPYIHVMVYHVPKMLKTYGSIKQFTGQGVEKSNDDSNMIYHRKTHKHCATAEALRVRQRKNMLKQNARVKR